MKIRDKINTVLFDSGLKGIEIVRLTDELNNGKGVTLPIVTRYRTGDRSVENMTLLTIEKLEAVYDHLYGGKD